MTKEIIASVAKRMSDYDLIEVGRSLETELTAAMASGVSGTQAHIGMIEMASACSAELWLRGYERGAKRDGSDLPKLVSVEDGARHSISVICF